MPDFYAKDGARLYYSDEGAPDGTPVLALAGLSRNGSDFDYLAPHLPEHVRFIRLDYRGRGRSDWTGAETYTIPTEAGDVLALLDHLEIPKAAILGTSRGGLVAMVLAVSAKDRLNGVCLVDIGPELADAGLETIRDLVETMAGAGAELEALFRTPELFLEELVAAHVALAEALAARDETEGGADLWADDAGEALAGFMADLATHGRGTRIAES